MKTSQFVAVLGWLSVFALAWMMLLPIKIEGNAIAGVLFFASLALITSALETKNDTK